MSPKTCPDECVNVAPLPEADPDIPAVLRTITDLSAAELHIRETLPRALPFCRFDRNHGHVAPAP